MPHTGSSLPRLSVPTLLTAITCLAVLLCIPQAARAAPYTLCAQLSDSSGQPAGTMVSACDPSSVSQTLSSTTFGDYTGDARASADSSNILRLFAGTVLNNYSQGSYIFDPSIGGVTFAASALALFNDMVTFTPLGPMVAHLTFDITGTLASFGAAGQLCYGFEAGSPLLGGPCVTSLGTVTLDSSPFIANGTPTPLSFEFDAVVFIEDSGAASGYSADAAADLEHTIVMKNLLLTDLAGAPITGVTLVSENGVNYPLSPLNGGSPIPEVDPIRWTGIRVS